MLIALFLQELLEELGCIVTGVAASAEAALARAGEAECDLALVDVGLAGKVDGIETALQLRDRFGIGVVFTSGADGADVMQRARHAQPLGFLSKPYTMDDLEAVLGAAVPKLRPTD